MAKTLISFLGTGNLNKEGTNSSRDYRKAVYSIDGEKAGESSFVASVLMDYYQIDNIILVGTVKSMWEEAYRYFCEKKGVPVDEDYYFKLADQIHDAGYKTKPSVIDLKPLREVLGEFSHAVVIPYGLNQTEQMGIFNTLSSTFEDLAQDEEVILDITHSFRSLPLFSTSVIQYLQSLSDKKIHFSKVYYGMLDVISEFDGMVPIVEVSAAVELQKWSVAGYAFKNYGKGQLLADLLGGEEGKTIQIFSDAVNLNYLSEIQQRLTNFKDAGEMEYENEFAKWVVPKVLSSFSARLLKAGNIQHLFQLELSSWHQERSNYGSAYIVFVESILTYVCEKAGVDWRDEDQRKRAKKALTFRDKEEKVKPLTVNLPYSALKKLRSIYKDANHIRNNIAHNLRRRVNKAQADIVSLKELQGLFNKIINKHPIR